MTTSGLPSHCPPEGHVQASGTFFRLTSPSLKLGTVPPQNCWILPLNNKTSEVYQKVGACEAYSHSIFDSLDTLIEARKFVRWAEKKSISQIDLVPPNGRMLNTISAVGDGHYDWWPDPMNFTPSAIVVREKP